MTNYDNYPACAQCGGPTDDSVMCKPCMDEDATIDDKMVAALRAQLAEMKNWIEGVKGASAIARPPNSGEHTFDALLAHHARFTKGGAYADGADILAEVDLRRRDAVSRLAEVKETLRDLNEMARVVYLGSCHYATPAQLATLEKSKAWLDAAAPEEDNR